MATRPTNDSAGVGDYDELMKAAEPGQEFVCRDSVDMAERLSGCCAGSCCHGREQRGLSAPNGCFANTVEASYQSDSRRVNKSLMARVPREQDCGWVVRSGLRTGSLCSELSHFGDYERVRYTINVFRECRRPSGRFRLAASKSPRSTVSTDRPDPSPDFSPRPAQGEAGELKPLDLRDIRAFLVRFGASHAAGDPGYGVCFCAM